LDGLAACEPLFGVILTLAAESVGLGLGLGLEAWPSEPEMDEVEQPLATSARTTRAATVAATQRQPETTAIQYGRESLVVWSVRLVLIALP
jgi:hypothetical protein